MNVEKIINDFKKTCEDSDVQKVIKAFYSYEDELLKLHEYESITLMNVDLIEYFYVHDILEKVIYFSVRYLKIVDLYGMKKSALYFALGGTLEYILENYDKAKEYLNMEMEAYRRQDNQRSVANCMCNMGALLNIEGNYLDAINLLLDAKMMLMSLNLQNTEYSAKVKLNISRAYIEIDAYTKAKKYLDEILIWDLIDEYPPIKIELYGNLGRYYIKLDNSEQAYMYLEEAVELAEEEHMIYELRSLYKYLGESYENHGDYLRSNKYYKKYSTLAWEMSRKTQKAIRQLAEVEITLKMRENLVKKQREKYLQIVREDEYDLLTNTFSKSYLQQYIKNLIDNIELHDSFSIMFISLKDINDLQKHYNFRAKEYVLVDLASTVINLCSELQIVARIEDNKLAVCFAGDQLKLSKEHAGTILRTLQNRNFSYEGQKVEVDIKAGLVGYESSNTKDVDDLFRMANLALYQAEKSGADSLVVW